MFCVNCGKQIVDTARFCNYCGVRVVKIDEKPVQNPAEIPENPLPIPVEDVKSSENVENSVDLLKMQNGASPDSAPMNELPEGSDAPFTEKEIPSSDIQSGAIGAQRSADVSPETEPAAQYGENIPHSEPIGTPLEQSAPAGTTPGQPLLTGAIPGQPLPAGATPVPPAPISMTAEPTKQPERRYTIGHIIMCLASTALMAIAAGVFAGLYFSVV